MIEKCSRFGSKFTKCFLIPQRYIMGIMLSLSLFSTYTMRVVLSIAITEMTPKPNFRNSTLHYEYCPIDSPLYFNSTQRFTKKYHWDENQQGIALSCFYWSYIIGHLPGALLAEKVGGKHVLGVGIMISSVFTILTPLLMEISEGSLYVMYALRIIIGLAQGPMYPVVTGMVAQWIPPRDKTFMASLAYSGALLGTAFTNLIGGKLIAAAGHWNAVFYFFGGLGLVWNLAWQLICYSFPKTHPCLKEKEKLYLEEELKKDVSTVHIKTPLKEIITSIPVWALIWAQFGHDWGWFMMVTDLPKYMSDILRFDVKSNGLYSSLPYFLMCISGVSTGYLGIKVNTIDLSPNFAGSVMAIVNGIGVIAGIVGPALVGVIVHEASLTEWRLVFWIAFGWLAGTNVIFLLFFSADVQLWNQSKEEQHEA